MARLTIQDLTNYFEPKIRDIVYVLQQQNLILPNIETNDGDIISPYNFVFFTDSGQYHKKIKEPNMSSDKKYPDILVLVKDGGGGQDTTSSLDVYLQVVSFEVYAYDDKTDEYKNQREAIQLIFSSFVQMFKSVTDNYMNNAIKIEAEDYPKYGNQLENKRFITTFDIDVTMLFHAQLSNNDVIRINGIDVPYINFSSSRQTLTTTSLEKITELKYLANKSSYRIDITLLYTDDNSMINALVDQCDSNEAFDQIYSVSIIRKGVAICNYEMLLESISLARSYGSVMAANVRFVPAYMLEE
jgi:hypothetical protein